MDKVDYTKLAKEIFLENKEKGFWDEGRSVEHCLMLIISEFSEAVEAFRKENWSIKSDVEDNIEDFDALDFKANISDTVQGELADTFIRTLDLCGHLELNVQELYDTQAKGSSLLTDANNFIENIYDTVCDLNYKREISSTLVYTIANIQKLAEIYDFDLMAHVELKRRYNKTRPRLHGKIC